MAMRGRPVAGDPLNVNYRPKPTIDMDAAGSDQRALERMLPLEGRRVKQRLEDQFQLLEDTAGRVGEDDAVASAQARAEQDAKNRAAQFERSTRTMDLSDRQKRASTRGLGLTRALNRASAGSSVRRGFAERSKEAGRIAGSLSDALFGQRLSSTEALAGSEAQDQATSAQRKAAKKGAALSTLGTVVGMAAMFMSSEKMKDDKGHEQDLLRKLRKVRVNRWNYKGDDAEHVGPFAEEFNREFGIKTEHNNMISVIDALGVTMGAVKELDKKVEAYGG